MEHFLQPQLLAEVGDSSTTTTAPPNAMVMTEDMTIASETSLSNEHHHQQQEEMSSRIPLNPAMASSSPSPTSSSVRHPLHIHHHQRQPTSFHEKQLGDDSRGRSNLHHATLAGNVANMSRHVADDTPCCSNFGQMGPCRRHYFFDVVAVCVGSSRHLLDFLEFICRNISLSGR